MKMALSHFSHLCRSVSVQRQVLQRWQPLVYGSVRWGSEEGKKDVIATSQPQQQDGAARVNMNPGTHRLSNLPVSRFEKFLLVWGGKYKSVADVPNFVSPDALERARNKARIKINMMMVVATILACIAMIYAGKRARAAGDSVVKMNQDWHKKINEEYKKEQGN